LISSSGGGFCTVCALFIILAGAISIPTLPIANYPTWRLRKWCVRGGYIGANAQTVKPRSTIPLNKLSTACRAEIHQLDERQRWIEPDHWWYLT